MVMFYDNDTRVTGICGELWYLLADYLNFTYVIKMESLISSTRNIFDTTKQLFSENLRNAKKL